MILNAISVCEGKKLISLKKLFIAVVFLFILIWTGCTHLSFRSPSVTLADIDILSFGLIEQRFVFKLRVQNPNSFDIAIKGLRFDVEINGKPFARGVSNKPMIVQHLDEQILEVSAVSDVYGLLRQLKQFLYGQNKEIQYSMKGQLWLDSFGEVNFERTSKLKAPNLELGIQ